MSVYDTCACGNRKTAHRGRCRPCADQARKGAPNQYRGLAVEIQAFARVIRREIDRRPVVRSIANGKHGRNWEPADYGASLADEIAASGLMSAGTAKRRLYSILNPRYQPRNGPATEQKVVSFEVADKILTALDLTYLWHTELAEAIIEPSVAKRGPAGSVEAPPSLPLITRGGRATTLPERKAA